LVVVLGALVGTLFTAAQNPPAKLTINDGLLISQALFSDGNGTYVDYRLTGGDPCVNGWVAKSGLFFMYLYRGSGFADDCNQHFPGNERTYTLEFPSASGACTELGLTPDASGFCMLDANDKPRFRSEKLFAKGSSGTPIAFLFFKDGGNYEVRSDEDVPITSSGSNIRKLSSATGTGTLWKIQQPPKKPVAVSSSFPFAFELTVERVP
jgi:hypothetical protein